MENAAPDSVPTPGPAGGGVVAGGGPESRAESREAAPAFPLLHNNASADTVAAASSKATAQAQLAAGGNDDDDDDEPAVAKPFVRTSSPDSASRAPASAALSDDDSDDAAGGEGGRGDEDRRRRRHRLVHKMHKFSLYETASRYYIVGGDVTEKRYRILKIDRTAEDSDLSITDDKITYTPKEMNQLLDTIDDGNKGTGGIRLKCTTWGLLGFIKFTGPYYMLLITKKSTAAMIGGHYIYQVEGTELVPLTPARYKADPKSAAEEARFLSILNNLDLTRSFYYSYSYDITRTLQYNVVKQRAALRRGELISCDHDYNTMFVWNSHLLQPALKALRDPFDWCRPIVHGYMDQASIAVYGRTAFITIIARRSRFFAGARFLKRGANDLGYVANDVETEQIVSEALTTSFHAPGGRLYASPQYTSYVQHRGSIPLYWTQDGAGVTPKPPIELNLIDPFYSAAALHFDNLFERYGAPVYVLNLVKARERTPRESKLLDEYTKAVAYLNQFLPEGRRIIYHPWDMSRAAKSRDQDVIGTLEAIAERVVTTTGFFHNGDGGPPGEDGRPSCRVQNGVARTNCIDCLDRTNAAQFVIGKRALGHQLHALGLLEDTAVGYDTDAVNLFTHMYHDHGDTIAVQYGGSQLVNTMETYRKINQWTSHSRDMIESFKRYYNNSFMDGQRQEAYNLFLGNYIFAQGQPMLWDLATDYYLHHADPRAWSGRRKRSYVRWYTPAHLEPRALPRYRPPRGPEVAAKPVSFFDEYWLEYYRPSTLSSFLKMFPYKMNSTLKYIPFKATQDGRYDLSPFRVRGGGGGGGGEADGDGHDKRKARKGVTILDPQELARAGRAGDGDDDAGAPPPVAAPAKAGHHHGHHGHGHARGLSLRWLQPSGPDRNGVPQSIMKETSAGAAEAESLQKAKQTALEKSRAAQWTFTKVVHESLNPSVSAQEAEDYARYVRHPQHLPLVVSADTPAEVDPEIQEFVSGSWQSEGLMAAAGDEDRAVYAELLRVGENPLTVTEEDAHKKRYRAYGKWLRGKSLFKQQPID